MIDTVAEIRVNTNQLNKALRAVQARVERVGVDRMMEIAKRHADEARRRFKDAIYDGENDVQVFEPMQAGPRTVEFIVTGYALPYIENGTGAKLNGPGYVNQYTKKSYWFFTSAGRKITLKAGGKPAEKYFYRTTKTLTSYHLAGKMLDKESVFYENGKPYINRPVYARINGQDVLHHNQKVPVFKRQEDIKLDKPERVPYGTYPDKFITDGNPPHFIVKDMQEAITDDLYKEFRATFK